MTPSDYRREYADYFSAVERERFEHLAGLKPRLELKPIEERYSDLWTLEASAGLRRALEATPADFETERRGLRALAGAARIKHAESKAAEATSELRLCEDSARVEWGGSKVNAGEVPGLLAAETDAARRGELSRRWFDALSPCDDLRAERWETITAAARGLGFGGRRALYESFTGVSLEELAAAADQFLNRTERVYLTRLSAWAALEVKATAGRELSFADQLFFRRAAHLEAFFPAADLRAALDETLKGLGVGFGPQRNLRVEAGARTSKDARPACFAVRPPEDVRLSLDVRASGAALLRQTFYEAGRAQMFAWASRETAARYPEFMHAPDAAAPAGHGFLLSGLARDAAWLGGLSGLRATQAQEVASSLALLELHEARRECAALRYALAVDESGDARAERLAETYTSLHDAATGFGHDAATRLSETEEFFDAAMRLRARLFAAGFAEHLRGRHGRRWFASRAAGDELADVWNTASRYAVEELARLLWGGELSFDLLADSLTEAAGI